MQFRLFAALSALMLPAVASATFMPENDLWKQDEIMRKDAGMTEQQFMEISNTIIAVFQPYAKMHNANLSVAAAWDDATVNAYADQNGDSWVVHMFGGLARRPEITTDGYKAVMCHELGHHFGGYAYFDEDRTWAAAEGQADYFATQACLPLIWGGEKDVNATFRANVPAPVKANCDQAWKSTDQQNLCYRISAAGQSLGNLLGVLGGAGDPDVTKPDASVVDTTFTAHPQAQCRLDTYFNGALCAKTFDIHTIPGRNHPDGQGSKGAQDEAAQTSCLGTGAMAMGERPRCWFAPIQ